MIWRTDIRQFACCVCGEKVVARSSSAPHPQVLEMVQLPPGAWAGAAESGRGPELLVACSEACRVEFLSGRA